MKNDQDIAAALRAIDEGVKDTPPFEDELLAELTQALRVSSTFGVDREDAPIIELPEHGDQERSVEGPRLVWLAVAAAATVTFGLLVLSRPGHQIEQLPAATIEPATVEAACAHFVETTEHLIEIDERLATDQGLAVAQLTTWLDAFDNLIIDVTRIEPESLPDSGQLQAFRGQINQVRLQANVSEANQGDLNEPHRQWRSFTTGDLSACR